MLGLCLCMMACDNNNTSSQRGESATLQLEKPLQPTRTLISVSQEILVEGDALESLQSYFEFTSQSENGVELRNTSMNANGVYQTTETEMVTRLIGDPPASNRIPDKDGNFISRSTSKLNSWCVDVANVETGEAGEICVNSYMPTEAQIAEISFEEGSNNIAIFELEDGGRQAVIQINETLWVEVTYPSPSLLAIWIGN
ncbi:MAG: hypothetical protein AAFP02_21770 [Bacteroidota bacterium]